MFSDGRRHILIMSSWFPNRRDAFVGNFVHRFAQLLSNVYHVSVIHTLGDPSCTRIEKEIEQDGDLTIVRVYHPVSKNKLAHWWWQKRALNQAFEEIEYVDLIFAHVILNRGLQFVKAKKYYHCPLIVMEHASYYREEISRHFNRLQRAIIKKTSIHINELLACSEFLQEDMKAIFPTTKSTVLPNFVDTTLFYPSDGKKNSKHRFLHVSTLDESVKDPETLLQGVWLLAQQMPEQFTLTVISDQPYEKWQQLAEETGITSYVTFEGPLSWEEIAERLREHDTFVLTSTYETFSIVVAEAWLTGLPTISTPVGIAKDLPESLGLQIPVKNPEALAEAMSDRINGKTIFDPETIRNRGLEYSEDAVIRQLVTIFESHFIQHD